MIPRVQHDDHCLLKFNGEDWRIVMVYGPFILLENKGGQAVLDAHSINWEGYQAVAAYMLGRKYGT